MKKIGIFFLSMLLSTSFVFAQNNQECKKPFVGMVGSLETVFTYQKDHCTPADFPDTPAMAFKDAKGNVHLFTGNAGSYMSVGSSFDTAKRDCSHTFYDKNLIVNALPESFDNEKWIRSPWTRDGKIIQSLVHNQFHGWLVRKDYYCPSGNRKACIFENITAAVSNDGGRTFKILRHQNNAVSLAMVTPYAFTEDGGSLKQQAGVRAPTNVISQNENGKTYYYVLANNRPSEVQEEGACLYRSDDISDPSHWRAWDGKGFNVTTNVSFYRDKMVDVSQHACKPVLHSDPTAWTYNKILKRYLAVAVFRTKDKKEAFGYFLSKDKLHWSKPTQLMEITMDEYRKSPLVSGMPGQGLPSIIDPESEGLNFEYSGSHPYLYYVRYNPKMKNDDWRNRDVVRAQLNIACED